MDKIYFPDSEFKNRAMMDDNFVAKMELFRKEVGYPTTITDDYRCEGHAKLSLHGAYGGKGKAFDGTNEAPLWDFINKALKIGFTGIGLYVKKESDGKYHVSYFHLDNRMPGDIPDTSPQFWIGVVKEDESIEYIYKMGVK